MVVFIVWLNGCTEQELGDIVIEGKGSFTSIQGAIDSASKGDKILVNSGTYYETLVISKSVSLMALDENNTIIEYKGNESNIVIISVKADDCFVSGFKIIGNNVSLGFGIEIFSSNNEIVNNTILGTRFGIYLSKSENNSISNNMIFNNDNGLGMFSSSNNNIISNRIETNKENGIHAHTQSNNNVFSENIVSSNELGIRIMSSNQNQVFRNTIKNNMKKGIYICCDAKDNVLFKNSLINNTVNADDQYNSLWHSTGFGNYWDDYKEKYPYAKDQNNDGIWDEPYTIYGETKDLYPLINPIEI